MGWNGYAACIMDDDGPNNGLGNMGLSWEYTSERQMRKKSKKSRVRGGLYHQRVVQNLNRKAKECSKQRRKKFETET